MRGALCLSRAELQLFIPQLEILLQADLFPGAVALSRDAARSLMIGGSSLEQLTFIAASKTLITSGGTVGTQKKITTGEGDYTLTLLFRNLHAQPP